MTPHDMTYLVMAASAIAAVILLITQARLHPFVALLLCSLGLGLITGGDTAHILKSVATGFGDTTASVGMVLALGAMFGALLSSSRGAERIADALIGACGIHAVPWAMAALALILGLPVFFETGLVMMIPIIMSVGAKVADDSRVRTGVSPYLFAGLPAIAGLSVAHGLIPPHPGPLAAITILNADLGRTLMVGLCIAFPTVILAGPLFTYWAARHAQAHPPIQFDAALVSGASDHPLPHIAVTLLTVLFPVMLMMAKAGADIVLPPASVTRQALEFAGSPVVALLLATLLAMASFGFALGAGRDRIAKLMGDALPPIAAIMLVIGAGGAFKQVLVDQGMGAVMARLAQNFHLAPLALGWSTAVLIRLATGSATVATVTAAGLMAGIGANSTLMVLAVGSGSLFFSHVNDAGFWLIKGYLGLSLPDMFKTWSLLETIISVSGLGFVLLASMFFQ